MSSQALPNYSVPAPRIESPLQSIGQLMQLKNGMAEFAVRQQQAEQERQRTEELKAQTEQRNRDLSDSNLIQESMKDPTVAPKILAGDFTPLQGKVQPKTLQGLEQFHTKHQADLLTNTKEQNGLAATNLGKIEDTILGLKQLGDPAAIAEAYPQALASLHAQKAFEFLPQDQIPQSFNGDLKQLDQMLAGVGGLRAATDKALSTQENKAKAGKAEEDLAQAKLVNPSLVTEAQQKALQAEQKTTGTEPIQPKDQATIDRELATAEETQRHNKELEHHGILTLGIDREKLKLEQQKAGLEMGGGISETAKMGAAGQMDPQTLRAALRKSPGLLNQIRAIDPNFDEANIDSRYNTLKEFTSTSTNKAGGQAIALNTLIHHADLYLDAADALHNGTFTPGNAIYNKVASLFGSAPPNNAALVARFLAGETGKVATGGVPAEGEIKGILSNLGTNASTEQMKEAGTKLLQIAAGRATPLMERVKQDKLENVVHILGPDAQEILSRRGFDPKTMKPVATGKAAPAVGTVIDGYKFKGGDPAQQSNWEKQ